GPHAQRRRIEEGDRSQVRRLELVGADDLEAGVGQRRLRIGNPQVVQLRGLVEPLEMRVQAEDGRTVGSRVGLHALENAGAVLEPVRKHVHLRLAPRDEVPVEPNELSWCESHDASIYQVVPPCGRYPGECPNTGSRSTEPRPSSPCRAAACFRAGFFSRDPAPRTQDPNAWPMSSTLKADSFHSRCRPALPRTRC